MAGQRWTRRRLLGGAGVTGAATVLSGLATASAQTDGEQGDLGDLGMPLVQQAGQPNPGVILNALPPINPAWTYRTISYQQFVARPVTNLATTLSGTGLGVTGPSGGATFAAALDLPQGAVVREVAFEVFNSHATAGLGVGFTRTDLGSVTPGGSFAFTNSGAGKHTIVINPSLFGVVDNTAWSYGLSAFLQPPAANFGLFGARVAWTNGLQLSPVNPPARKLDTRLPGPLTGKLQSGQTRTLSLGPEAIPGAKAALVNLTITNTEGSGFLALFAAGTTWPGTSSINWSGFNQILANSATVLLSPTQSINILCGGGGRTHVVVDLAGYYT